MTDVQNKIQNIESLLSAENSGDSESILGALDTEIENFANNGYLPSQVDNTLLAMSVQVEGVETNGHPTVAAVKAVEAKLADMATNGNLTAAQKQQLDAILDNSIYLTEDADYVAVPGLLTSANTLLESMRTSKNSTAATAAETLIADAIADARALN